MIVLVNKCAIKMTTCLIFPLPVVSDDRSPRESSWERHTAGSNLGTDGVRGADAPALLGGLEPSEGSGTNGIDGRGEDTPTPTGEQAASELGDGRSPVEEAGHEVEGVGDEELCSTVEEGEEAALALDAPQSDSGLQWLPFAQKPCHPRVDPLPCTSQDDGHNKAPGHVEVFRSNQFCQNPDLTSTEDWGIHCRSGQSDTCRSDNMA